MDPEKLVRHLEATPIEKTKQDLISGHCGPINGENHRFVSNWVTEQEDAVRAAASSRAEAREIRLIEISNESLSVAKSARLWAIVAILVSVIAILFSSHLFSQGTAV